MLGSGQGVSSKRMSIGMQHATVSEDSVLSQEGGECVEFVFRVVWQVYSQWRQTRLTRLLGEILVMQDKLCRL